MRPSGVGGREQWLGRGLVGQRQILAGVVVVRVENLPQRELRLWLLAGQRDRDRGDWVTHAEAEDVCLWALRRVADHHPVVGGDAGRQAHRQLARSWKTRDVLLGECTWGAGAVDHQTVRDFLNRAVPLALAELPEQGAGWRVRSALFARAGAAPAAACWSTS